VNWQTKICCHCFAELSACQPMCSGCQMTASVSAHTWSYMGGSAAISSSWGC
jgi:hypothetical protein